MTRDRINAFLSRIPTHTVVLLMVLIWIVPTFGLLVTSFRPLVRINTSGWWTVFLPGAQPATAIPADTPQFTLDNYIDALTGYRGTRTYEEDCAAGTPPIGIHCDLRDLLNSRGMALAFLNSMIVTVPSVVLPILLASFAGYAFAWLHFKGKYLLFAVLVGLQVVPLQITLVPISLIYARIGLSGSFLGIWLFHTGFGLPYAIYLMRNFFGYMPREMFESAYLEGATHWTVFRMLAVPLAMPAIASLGIYQFLWVWSDLLVALIFLGGKHPVMTYQISNMVSSLGAGWELLTAAAFLLMLPPLILFVAFQRYFQAGMLAGSIKG
jgi:alpha-glucoside transport system permease protein